MFLQGEKTLVCLTRTILEKISDDMDTFILLVAVSFIGWKFFSAM